MGYVIFLHSPFSMCKNNAIIRLGNANEGNI